MRKINKANEPDSLTRWKRHHPNGVYEDLSHVERQDVRSSCLKEQFYLCAYCCQSISLDNSVNEHVEARKLAPQKQLNYANIVASCKTPKQCDAAHASQPLKLTPLMEACEHEFKFKISGRVEGITARAVDTIQVLNLGDTEKNNRSLIEKRKQLSQALLWTNGIDPEAGIDDDELIAMLIEDIENTRNGKLEAYAPVVVNILRSWLGT